MHELILRFLNLIDNPARLPEMVAPNRYLLLITLQNVNEQASELIIDMMMFQPICQSSLKKKHTLQNKIQRKFEILLQDYNDAIASVTLLSDEARFKEREATSSEQRKSNAHLSEKVHFFEKHGQDSSTGGKMKLARDYFSQALRLVNRVGDRAGEGRILNNLGKINSVLGKKEDALFYLERALVIVREVGDRREESRVLDNLGSVCIDLGYQEEALKYLEYALVISREISDLSEESSVLNKLGLIYNDLGKKQQARMYFEHALKIDKMLNDRREEGTTLSTGYHKCFPSFCSSFSTV